MSTDPLATLARQTNVAESSDLARSAIDALLWNRAARRIGADLSAESTLVGAWCTSAFEGAEVLMPDLRNGVVEDSPMGHVAAGALAMYAELPIAANVLSQSPMQALARMQSLTTAGRGHRPDPTGPTSATTAPVSDDTGRPRATDDVSDPLRLGTALPAAELVPRLNALGSLLTGDTSAPALVLAGIAHAEIATIQPFASGSGLVARGLTRAVLRERGVDPDGWSMPEAGMRILGRPSYVKALRGYAEGTEEGVVRWLVHHAQLVQVGAQEAETWVAEQPTV